MLAVVVTLASFVLFAYATAAAAAVLNVPSIVLWIAYYALSEYADARRLLHMPALRGSSAVRWLAHEFMRSRFSPAGRVQLGALAADQQYVFACEPHGAACLSLVFGFAAHGGGGGSGGLDERLASRILVVAHRVYRLVPIVRTIYSVFGVIDNSRESIEAALNDHYSLALVPSGVAGKYHSLVETPNADDNNDNDSLPRVYVPCCGTPGIFAYAAARGIAVVPVLSPQEPEAFLNLGAASRIAAIVSPFGWWFVRPRTDVEFHVGRPIVTKGARTNALAIARLYYAELEVLGGRSHAVHTFSCHCSAWELALGDRRHCTRWIQSKPYK